MNAVTTMTTNPSNSALMLSQGLLAGHFTRAEQLQILNPEGNVIATLPNPAAAEGCHGKQALLDALTHHQVGQVVVRNIGERMLGRLLAVNIRVLQCRSARAAGPRQSATSHRGQSGASVSPSSEQICDPCHPARRRRPQPCELSRWLQQWLRSLLRQ